MASSVASCERFLPTNASNHVNFRQHFRSKEVQLDRHQTVTKWSESRRFTIHRLKTESEIEGNKNEGHNGKFEGNAGSCTCSMTQVEKKKVMNADETITIETAEPKEGDTVNREGKNKPGPKRICRVVSLKDKEFQRRIKQTPNIFDEMSKTSELSVSTEAKNSEFMREAKNYHNEEKKIQTESTLATPNNLPSTPHLDLSIRKPFLNDNVQNVTRTSENRVTVEVKIRIQPNNSTPSLETTERNNRETGDERHETAEESSANGSVLDSIESKRRLCDQNYYSPTSKEVQAANTYEISMNKTATVPREPQTSLKVSKDYSDSKQLSLNVDVQSRQDAAETNRDDFLGKISDDDDNEVDDSSLARDPLVVLSQLTDKTSLHGFNVDEISSAGDETVRNSTDSRPAIEDVEPTESEFQLDVNRKPAELRTRRIRAVTIAGINPEFSEIMKNYQTPESFLIAESKKHDVTKSDENLGSVGNLRENQSNAAAEPRDRVSLGRSISLHQPNAYGLQPRLWKLPSFRSYSNNTAIFTSDRSLLQQLSDEVKDILMADARRRRISSNEIQKTAEKTEDDEQQHYDANYHVRTEDKLSPENQFNDYSTFNDATEFQGVQRGRSNLEETADLDETTPRKSHNNGATDVDFPTSESMIIQDCGSNLSTSELASKPRRPSDFAFQATEDKITEPKPRANHIDDEKGDRDFLDALSDDMLAKALERMVIIAASEEYLKLVDLREREELEYALRRQRKDGRQFQPRRSLHEKCLSANEKPQNPLAESGDKSYGFAQKVDDDDKDEEPSISFSESLNN